MTSNQIQARPAPWRHLVGGVVLTLAWGGLLSAAPERRAPVGKISEKALSDAKANSFAPVEVLVRFKKAPGAQEKALMKAMGGHVGRRLGGSRWMAVRLPARVLAALASRNEIEFVATDAEMSPSMDIAREAAHEPGPAEPESVLKGAGVTIAMLDSGVAATPEILTQVAVDVVAQDPPVVLEVGSDPHGHGTHVAGIMVGNGSNSSDGRLRGLAPESALVSVRVIDEKGHGKTSDVLAGLQWVIDNKDALGIRVLNLSIGHPVYEPSANDPLVQAVEAAWDAGIVVVCSAGNAGTYGHGTISSPCNSPKVITVGALNAWHTPETTDDTVTTYSSRGPTVFDLVAKPDLLAPGNKIVSVRSAGSHLDEEFPERRVAGDPASPEVQDYFELSGTSMAAPMVSAAAALMLQQDPQMSPATVKARLMLSAGKATVADPFTTGAGALDILAALRAPGEAAVAPSPKVLPDPITGDITVEDTGKLWSDPTFSIQAVWSDAVLWADPTEPDQAILWSKGVLWPDGTTPYALLWPDSLPEAILWPDTDLWGEAILWPDAVPPDQVETQAEVVEDP
jgi:serine protease AprX